MHGIRIWARHMPRFLVTFFSGCAVLGAVFTTGIMMGYFTAPSVKSSGSIEANSVSSEKSTCSDNDLAAKLAEQYGPIVCIAHEAYERFALTTFAMFGETEEAKRIIPHYLIVLAIVGYAYEHPEIGKLFVREVKARETLTASLEGLKKRAVNARDTLADGGGVLQSLKALGTTTGTRESALQKEYGPHEIAWLMLHIAAQAPGAFADQFAFYKYGHENDRGTYRCDVQPFCIEFNPTTHFLDGIKEFLAGSFEDFYREYVWEKLTGRTILNTALDATLVAGGFWRVAKIGKTAAVLPAKHATKAVRATRTVQTVRAVKVTVIGTAVAVGGYNVYNLITSPVATLHSWAVRGVSLLAKILPDTGPLQYLSVVFGPSLGMILLFLPILVLYTMVALAFSFLKVYALPVRIGYTIMTFVIRPFCSFFRWLYLAPR